MLQRGDGYLGSTYMPQEKTEQHQTARPRMQPAVILPSNHRHSPRASPTSLFFSFRFGHASISAVSLRTASSQHHGQAPPHVNRPQSSASIDITAGPVSEFLKQGLSTLVSRTPSIMSAVDDTKQRIPSFDQMPSDLTQNRSHRNRKTAGVHVNALIA
ncbi:hypothetical protein NM208_g7339 [Fusarium decemcellulare]|uniref:Uncharacterized protein n=1 Tax=Fusarium decemcellulare TaxID=57161 RepID=A0ACC1S9N9_9HYPO|nr:hypothetical protein NM208_g7339 [Fusarium decemcellulare]